MIRLVLALVAVFLSLVVFEPSSLGAQSPDVNPRRGAKRRNVSDARNRRTGKTAPEKDPALAKYGIYAKTAPRASAVEPVTTELPLRLEKGDRVAFVGGGLLEEAQHFGYLEALIQQRYPHREIVVRNLAWSADTPSLQPRPANFADLDQHLTHEKIDVIFAAFGFNESFAGEEGIPSFREELSTFVSGLQRKAFNGTTGPRIVLLSPIANENVATVPAADRNNERLAAYTEVVREVAKELRVGFIDVFVATRVAMSDPSTDLTFNGSHLVDEGYALFADTVYRRAFGETAPSVNHRLRETVVDKNRQYFRRYRPLNTFYYTGDRNKSYGYLDFLPAMRNFEIMVENRDRRAWSLARGETSADVVDDSNVPPLPETAQSRGANEWMSAKDELAAFEVDPRFDVTLFAGEEEFPDIAAPIQMRWDARGRLWVSCSTTYPHIYPGSEPDDKIVILEDTDGDGKADRSSVFADDVHIPLSFELGHGGVYVSEEPYLTFLKDTDGDGKADFRRRLLGGFGCEDSHHALHDFVWTPDGDLIFREGIFHHSQVETPYGPVRQANSGWFRFDPKNHRFTSFGTYHSTNPWGVTFDRWGQHLASHPIFASAFHALDPPYPTQHPRPKGLRAYSGTCGQEFVDFDTFPEDLQDAIIKVRYKPTNRVEILRWNEGPFGYDEEYEGDLIFSKNLSFIPVDIGFGPRGALYVCDWYNPIKGHAQYSLRDDRRDRHSGRIWRITAKGRPLQDPPRIAGASVDALVKLLERKEYRYRYWAKRELRDRDPDEVATALGRWLETVPSDKPDRRHHQIEAVWTYRGVGRVNAPLLRELLGCDEHHARAAATRQLRYWHTEMDDAITLLRRAANDPNGLVRLEAAIAATYIGTKEALDAMLDVAKHPRGEHLAYAFATSLGSHTLRRHWEGDDAYSHVPRLLDAAKPPKGIAEPKPDADEARFDAQKNLARVDISCLPERMKYTVERFTVATGQPVKLVFTNPDATDHNLVIVRAGALEEVGMAANDMAKDPRNANSDFIPSGKEDLIVGYAPMIGPTRKSRVHVLRFLAPKKPGIYPYVCTFPGHWVVMTGEMIVADSVSEVDALLAARKTPKFVKNWTLADLEKDADQVAGRSIMRGMKAFIDARCGQCHAIGGHGAKFGPDLTKVAEKYRGKELLRHLLEPSVEIQPEFLNYQIVKKNGNVVFGTLRKEDDKHLHLVPSLLTPDVVTKVAKRDVLKKVASKISPMPEGMLSVLTRDEILDLLAFIEAGGYKLPEGLQKKHDHDHGH